MTEKFLSGNSDLGGALQTAVAAGVNSKLSDNMPCTSSLIWTPDAGVYLNIGDRSNATKFLLPSNVILPMPVDNLNLVQAFNSGAGTATIHILYRSR